MENKVKSYINNNTNTVTIEVPWSFAKDDSFKAVARKIARMARKLKLRQLPWYGPLTFDYVSKKDARRVAELLRYANGRAIAKTARNNYGRRNGFAGRSKD